MPMIEENDRERERRGVIPHILTFARIFEMQVPLGNRTSVPLHVSGGNLAVVVVVRVTVVTVVV